MLDRAGRSVALATVHVTDCGRSVRAAGYHHHRMLCDHNTHDLGEGRHAGDHR